MPNQPISVDTANEMIKEYNKYMSNLGVDMQYQTQSVSFDPGIFAHWMSTVMPFSDELRIFMACYLSGRSDAGRTTVIIWPYFHGEPAKNDDGNTIEPFNEGNGLP